MQPLLLLLACSDYQLRKQKPALEISVSSLDFEEVVVGTWRTGTVSVANEGRGVLQIDGVALDGSEDYALQDALPDTLEPGDEAALPIRYTPDAIGPDDATLTVASNDPSSPLTTVPVTGEGVEPEIDVDPESLWFGDVEAGATETQSVDINARGQGQLKVTDIGFVDAEGEVFTIELPEDLELPISLSPGTGFSFDVSFTPVDDSPWDGAIYVHSNDPDDEEVLVRLLANAEGSGEEAPLVEITWPDWGNRLIAGQQVTLAGVVVDDLDDPTDLVALWYADGTLLGSSTPDAEGAVTFPTDDLPTGEITLRLAALDTNGQVGEDEVVVSVQDPEEPFLYTLTGGSSLWDYWSVDDDIAIYLDDTEIWLDANHTQDNHPPFEIEAVAGQTLRIVATDFNYCDQMLDALTLHFGTGESQALNEYVCRSACPDHPCYDPDFDGPWPATFLDETYTISIP